MVTVAVNCWGWPPYTVVVAGLKLTATGGDNVIAAEADAAVLAWLVAVMLTVCAVVMAAGAVYSPEGLTVPVPAGDIVQVTAVLLVLVTVAVISCV